SLSLCVLHFLPTRRSSDLFSSKLLSLISQPYLSYVLDGPDVMGVTKLMQQVANLLIPVVSLGVSYAIIRFGLDKTQDKSSVFVNGLATIALGFARSEEHTSELQSRFDI